MPDVGKTLAVMADVVVAALILMLIAPLFAVIALCVAVESRGKVFYRARRAGYRGETVSVLKFTKMVDRDGLPLTTTADDRFTRVGRVLAKTKLDELPQLINVVRGEMALVGPRPEDPQFVALHPNSYDRILSVRPGITGVSQLAYASESEILLDDDPVEDYIDRVLPQKVRLDVKYAERKSLLLDARVLFWTIAAVVLRRDVAVNRGTLALSLREQRSPSRTRHDAPARTAGREAAFDLPGVREGVLVAMPAGAQLSTAQARGGELRVLEPSS